MSESFLEPWAFARDRLWRGRCPDHEVPWEVDRMKFSAVPGDSRLISVVVSCPHEACWFQRFGIKEQDPLWPVVTGKRLSGSL